MIDKTHIAEQFRLLQDRICQALEVADGGGKFLEDNWLRPEGGGGRSRVLEGRTIEKGGVMFSAVHGPLPEITANAMNLAPTDFFATGVSIVLHPHSPMAPIIHMNVRYFETAGGERWWFGGGIDLTPHYVVPEDAQFFHQQLRDTCERFSPTFYPDFKKQADDYFFLKHRQETRGVGGIFYDYLDEKTGFTQEKLFEFALAVGILLHRPTRNCSNALLHERTGNAKNVGKCYAGGVTWSSTWCGTEAPNLGSKPMGERKAF
jgi:coproporphyrinogen III oxidase